MVAIFQDLQHYQQLEFFRSFLFWIWMILNLLYFHMEQICGTAIILLMLLHDYHCILLNYTWALLHQDLLFCLRAYYLIHLRSQWMVAVVVCYMLIFLSTCLEAASAPAPIIVTVPKYVRIIIVKKSWL